MFTSSGKQHCEKDRIKDQNIIMKKLLTGRLSGINRELGFHWFKSDIKQVFGLRFQYSKGGTYWS